MHASSSKAWLMGGVASGAIILSTGVAVIGVAGVIGIGSPLAIAGTVALLSGTVMSEIAASRLPVHAEQRAQEKSYLKSGAVVAGFLALTGWNMTAGHLGASAVLAAGVADKRAPLEAAYAAADASARASRDALADFDTARKDKADRIASGLRGAFASGYVSAAARAMKETPEEQRAAESRRDQLNADKAAAEAKLDAARIALDHAPKTLPDWAAWGFAAMLELLKGALVWFSTGKERKGATVAIGAKTVQEMTEAELKAAASAAAAMAANVRHERKRRLQLGMVAA